MQVNSAVKAGRLGILLLCGVAAGALAQNPGKPITIVIPTGPGASNDIETRMYGQK